MDFKHYEEIASRVRTDIVKAVHKAGSGHPGGSLSAADIVTAPYFKEMHIDPQHPQMEGRDKFILSKGHAGPVQYAALAEKEDHVIFGGRLAEYKYYDMDKVIASALKRTAECMGE